jgi:hypothetical protein
VSTEEPDGPGSTAGEPTEEELRAAFEAELSRLTTADLIAQAVVSLLNLGARRLGSIGGPAPSAGGETGAVAGQEQPAAGERDLGQVRDAIDAVRPLLEILERNVPEGVRPLRDALAQLQMAYAREVQPGAPGNTTGGQGASDAARDAPQRREPGADDAPPSEEGEGDAGPAQRSGRLWVPGT